MMWQPSEFQTYFDKTEGHALLYTDQRNSVEKQGTEYYNALMLAIVSSHRLKIYAYSSMIFKMRLFSNLSPFLK